MVKKLREHVGLTQAQVAERGGLERVEVNQIERGENSCSSWRIRAWLAQAFGVQATTIAAYLDGALDFAGVVGRVDGHEAEQVAATVRPLSARPEWPAVLAAAQAAAAVTEPDITDADWKRAGQMYDGPSVPQNLTPRLVLQLTKALRGV